MISVELENYFYNLLISGIIFYLFVALLTVFGFIFLNLILKKLIKDTEGLSLIEKFFLSFAIGTSIYLSLSFFLLMFAIFNFYTAYLSLIVIDITFVLYRTFKKTAYNQYKISYLNFVIKVKENRKKVGFLILALISVIILQFSLQWPLFTEANGLMFLDPYGYLREIYILLDYDTIEISSHFFYPPGLVVFCGGSLQITSDYMSPFYFLKFGGIHLLFLFVIFIFYLSFKMFKKIYISLCCSILFLSFYLYTFRANAFLTGSVSILFVAISLLLFLKKDKRYLCLLGFFLPVVYFFNPVTSIYYTLLIFGFLCFYLFLLNFKKDFLGDLMIILIILALSFVLILPDYIYLVSEGYSFNDLFNWYLNLVFQRSPAAPPSSGDTAPPPEQTNLTKGIFETLFQNGFLFADSIAFRTMFICFGLAFIGLLYRISSKDDFRRKILIFCKISFGIIIVSYLLVITNFSVFFFFITFQDRIFETFSPVIIISCGFGLIYLDELVKNKNYLNRARASLIQMKGIKTVFAKLSKTSNSLKEKHKGFKKTLKFENLFKILLLSALLAIQLSQHSQLSDLTSYSREDETVDAYLYLRVNVPTSSSILTPESDSIRKILYDMDHFISPFNINSSFSEFENYIIENNINYLLLNKSNYNSDILDNLENLNRYEEIHENDIYLIYKVMEE